MERSIIDSALVYNCECLGCKRHEKDIMVTFISRGPGDMFNDFFLTQKQAIELRNQLNIQIERNWEFLPVEEKRDLKLSTIL